MARGGSGRIVIEVDPHLKSELYVELARQQRTLKAWFIAAAERLIVSRKEQALIVAEGEPKLEPTPAVESEAKE